MVSLFEKLKNRLDSASDAGASIVEWVLIMVLAIGIIAVAGTAVMNTVNTKAKTLEAEVKKVQLDGK